MQPRLVPLLALPLFSSLATAAPQGELFTFPGKVAVNAGDLDNDGKLDFLVGEVDDSGATGGSVVVYAGRDGAALVSYQPTAPVTVVGNRVAALGDENGDGVLDFAAFEAEGSAQFVAVVSGATGTRLYRCPTTQPYEAIWDFVALGDVDGDGQRDLAISEFDANYPPAPGVVRVRSGANGALLRTINAPASQFDGFGFALDLHSDLDGDGVRDLVVGAPASNGPGAACIVSPATGATLFTSVGNLRTYGDSVASLGDADGDGTSDIAVGDPDWVTNGYPNNASVRIVAVPSGATIQTIQAQYNQVRLGFHVERIGDFDGDGLADVLLDAGHDQVGCCHFYPRPSEIRSGLTGALLFTSVHDAETSLDALGDVDGNGSPDYAAGEHDTGLGVYRCAVVLTNMWATCVLYHCWSNTNFNSLGCNPSLASYGAPSLTSGDDFGLLASKLHNNRPGLLVWSVNQATSTIGSQSLCVGGPRRTFGAQSSGGSATGANCTGQMSFPLPKATMAAFGWTAGSYVFAQAFSRDPNAASTTQISLTTALGIQVWP